VLLAPVLIHSSTLVQNLFQSSHEELGRLLLRESSDAGNPAICAHINKCAAGVGVGHEGVRIDPDYVSGPGAQACIGRKRCLKLLTGVRSSIRCVGVARHEVHADGVVNLAVGI
jgi:hypothetical protein